jgi:cytochrome c oxidase subunit 3
MYKQPYHIVDVSPWPFYISFALLGLALNLVNWLATGSFNLAPLVLTIAIVILWFRDIIREAYGGFHTIGVQDGILLGFILFILSEIMLFVSFFWAFFNSSLAPGIDLGSVWPPVGINFIDPYNLPFFGSLILISSGVILTLAHHAFLAGDKEVALYSLLTCILVGAIFPFTQAIEYYTAEFTIADNVFGSVFFMTTGLHAIHVIAGLIFLTVSLFRILKDQMTIDHNLGFEFSIYYWHLVDVVWIFVYLFYYIWTY